MPKLKPHSFIDPAKSKLFYGYVILFVGTLGVYCSIPGQTIGVSVFTDPVKDALGLSRNQFSNAYMIGTIISSLFIGRAGIWFDKFGARKVALGAVLVLSLTIFLCSWSADMSLFIQHLLNNNSWWIPFLLMTVLFFMLRFTGQGILTMASRNMIMIWFDRHRGKVNMFTSVALSFGFSSSPLWINYLIEGSGWQMTWQYMGFGLLFFSVLVYFLYKNHPEEHGLHPDGYQPMENDKAIAIKERQQFTMSDAKKTRAFWMYGLTLAFNSFFITGLTFHVVSVFASEGYPKEDAISIFLPGSIIAVSVSTLFNWLSDRLSLKILLYLMLFGGFCASIGFLLLSQKVGIPLLIAGFGIMGGFFAVLNAVAWPRFYGRLHLGAITGKIMSFLVLASALAPPIFSVCFSTFGNYRLIGYLGLGYVLFLIIGSVKANNPQ